MFFVLFPTVFPPVLSVPPGGQIVSVREGGNADLVCSLVEGKPRPPILWSRTEKDLLMPSGTPAVETPDGRLRLKNVSRDMMGLYRCQTAPYNGLNIKRREAQVQLNVQCKYPLETNRTCQAALKTRWMVIISSWLGLPMNLFKHFFLFNVSFTLFLIMWSEKS